jgi:hypothetical protein
MKNDYRRDDEDFQQAAQKVLQRRQSDEEQAEDFLSKMGKMKFSSQTTNKTWEELLKEAIASLRAAHAAMDDLAGWSGSSGNWPLHECLVATEKALSILDPLTKPSETKE